MTMLIFISGFSLVPEVTVVDVINVVLNLSYQHSNPKLGIIG